MKVVPLTQGKIALVSDKDWSAVRKFKWFAVRDRDRNWYAQASIPSGRRNPPKIQMHRMIMGFPEGDIDHRDCNGLNNIRSNLRRATRTQNLGNRGKTRLNTSGFKGVTWDKNRNKWKMQIKCAGVFIQTRFNSKRAAAIAYAQHAKELFGRFART